MTTQKIVEQQFDHVLGATAFEAWLGAKQEGKARDNYLLNGRRVMIATDRVSAFDQHLGFIPFKGQVVTEMSAFWFERTADIVSNHLIELIDPNVLLVEECAPLPIEMVVRAYLTGVTPTSIWYQYERGAREFCGHRLPDGLRKNHRLPSPIVTPSTKAPKGARDESISVDEAVRRSLVSAAQLEQMSEVALRLFRRGSEVASSRGFILVDTKYEFGLDKQGNLRLIDEIHTPDSSRFWPLATYSSLYEAGEQQPEYDKEFIRLWLAARGFDGAGPVPEIPKEIFVGAALRYIEVCEAITEVKMRFEAGDPTQRIAARLDDLKRR
jgi:phosphoribosylaminoimidazole-succinocarboxamide synthase